MLTLMVGRSASRNTTRAVTKRRRDGLWCSLAPSCIKYSRSREEPAMLFYRLYMMKEALGLDRPIDKLLEQEGSRFALDATVPLKSASIKFVRFILAFLSSEPSRFSAHPNALNY